jgi:hypothetical protein
MDAAHALEDVGIFDFQGTEVHLDGAEAVDDIVAISIASYSLGKNLN